MPDAAIVLIRSLLAYLVLFLLARAMGRVVIAQLTFFEFVVGITIGDFAASMAMDINSVKFTEGLIAMLIFAGVTMILGGMQLKNRKARRILEGEPIQLIRNGRILEKNLAKERFSVDELMAQLRLQQVFRLDDVETAYLETNGQVSVQLKADRQPVQPQHLHLSPATKIPRVFIQDGQVDRDALAAAGLDEAWLRRELSRRYGISSPNDVFLAQWDGEKHLYVDLKDSLSDTSVPSDSSFPSKKRVLSKFLRWESEFERRAREEHDETTRRLLAHTARELTRTRRELMPHLP